jgi:alkylation response protein AidB-like acyl-CoA dehydrogenase
MSADDEVSDYRAAIDEFAKEYATSGRVRAASLDGAGWDESAWSVAAQQLGVTSLLIPEAQGGAGADAAVAAAAARSLAAGLAPGPYLGSMVAGALLSAAPDVFGAALAAIADGSLRVATAFSTLEEGDHGVTAGEGVLGGALESVPDAASATHLALVTWTGGSPAAALVDLASAGVEITPLESLDLTRPSARVVLDGAAATIAPLEPGAVAQVRDIATVLVIAEQVGVSETALAHDVAYSLERYAFGRQIGSFQALKNQLAELYCVIEQMQAMLHRALSAVLRGDGAREANEAACFAGPASVRVTTEALRLLGGIGFTWEHDAHLRLRRTTANEYLVGTPYSRRRRLAADLGLAS